MDLIDLIDGEPRWTHGGANAEHAVTLINVTRRANKVLGTIMLLVVDAVERLPSLESI